MIVFIIVPILSALFALTVSDVIETYYKPIICAPCFSFWCCLLFFSITDFQLISVISAFSAYTITRLISKYLNCYN